MLDSGFWIASMQPPGSSIGQTLVTIKPIELLGGESVYCINQSQLKNAFKLAQEDPVSSPKIQAALAELEGKLSRNERASLAFVMIDRLLKSAEK